MAPPSGCGTRPDGSPEPAPAETALRRRRSTKLGPGSPPVGNRGRLIAAKAIAPASLTTLLHVVADEFLGVVLEDLVDLVEEVVDLGLETLAPLGRRRCLF